MKCSREETCNYWHLFNSSWLSEVTGPNRRTIIADCTQWQIPLNIHKKIKYFVLYDHLVLYTGSRSTDTQYSRSGTHALRLRNWLVTVGCVAYAVAVVLLWESVLSCCGVSWSSENSRYSVEKITCRMHQRKWPECKYHYKGPCIVSLLSDTTHDVCLHRPEVRNVLLIPLRFPTETRDFCPLHIVQTGCGIHTAPIR
jgi:hypothetical protein